MSATTTPKSKKKSARDLKTPPPQVQEKRTIDLTSTPGDDAASAEVITIGATVPDTVKVDLVGVRYAVRPMKTAAAVRMAETFKVLDKNQNPSKMKKGMYALVHDLFGPEQEDAVIARLESSDDALDFQHVVALMNAVIERATGNPSTSPSA